MGESNDSTSTMSRAVRTMLGRMTEEERAALFAWAESARLVREDSGLSTLQRLTRLRKLDYTGPKALIRACAKEGKRLAWDERGWATRLALSGAALGLALFGSGWAGLAAGGGAIGIPAFLLSAGGGALLGAILEECRRKH